MKHILIYADWENLKCPILIGHLYADQIRGKEVFSFEYEDEWLAGKHFFALDPEISFLKGRQYADVTKMNFGMFLDSSPDRWGRLLMKRREAIIARKEERKAKTLLESDFLLGVYDGNRMGALRFKTDKHSFFLSSEITLAAPPWSRLRELEFASLQLEKEDTNSIAEELRWLNMLMAPGSSLGGARPKASVTDPEGNLWIAKFPSANDEIDVGAWEMVVHQLALQCGINVPEATIKKLSSKHHTFLTKRFDRNKNKRIHFSSAMTLLGQVDGADYHDGLSYLNIAEVIQQSGNEVNKNLKELWQRIVFNILVKNTDDHLRNHGFLLSDLGWELSPAYDMNPVPSGNGLTLNISEQDNSLNVDIAVETAHHYRVPLNQAKKTITDFQKIIFQWHTIASEYNLSSREKEKMEPAFN